MSPEDLEILKHMMNGATPPDFAVRLLEDICERTNLSWKARHVYLQKRRNKTGTDSWQAVLSIDGFRAVGSRHPDYAGQEGPLFVTASDGSWTDIPPDGKPYAAKVGIRKKSGLTTWGVAKYADYYAGMMWDKLPSTMVAKCAEMLAWRKTFPETFGGLYGDAEMDQTQKDATSPRYPKESLKEMEVIGSVPVPEAQVVEGLRDVFMRQLKEAKDYESVIQIGKDITIAQKEKALGLEDTLQLHQLYNQMKKKYG